MYLIIHINTYKSMVNEIEGYELVGGVIQFYYMGRPLDQSNNNWTEILWNNRREKKVGGGGGGGGKGTVTGGDIYLCVGNILLRGGARSYVVWLRIVGHVGGNDKGGGENQYKLPKAYHG